MNEANGVDLFLGFEREVRSYEPRRIKVPSYTRILIFRVDVRFANLPETGANHEDEVVLYHSVACPGLLVFPIA